jgi:hypothetical protein
MIVHSPLLFPRQSVKRASQQQAFRREGPVLNVGAEFLAGRTQRSLGNAEAKLLGRKKQSYTACTMEAEELSEGVPLLNW